MKISKLTATILIIFICFTAICIVKFVGKQSKSNSLTKIALSRTKGDAKARVHITEYIDFQCPACARGSLMLKEYTKKYPSDIYLEVKYYPISKIHQYALKSAMYAECAARQNKFWAFQDILIEKQSQWAGRINADPMLKELAQDASLDLKKLEACIEDDSVKAAILQEKSDAKSLGVDSTPTYFVNGKMVVGPKPLAEELAVYLKGENHQ